MALGREHEIHHRRFGRNLGVGLVLGAFVILLFGLSIVKIKGGDTMQAFDHTARPGLVTEEEEN
jgi:hypothetical protein